MPGVEWRKNPTHFNKKKDEIHPRKSFSLQKSFFTPKEALRGGVCRPETLARRLSRENTRIAGRDGQKHLRAGLSRKNTRIAGRNGQKLLRVGVSFENTRIAGRDGQKNFRAGFSHVVCLSPVRPFL